MGGQTEGWHADLISAADNIRLVKEAQAYLVSGGGAGA